MPLLILTVKLPNIFVARFNVVPTDFEFNYHTETCNQSANYFQIYLQVLVFCFWPKNSGCLDCHYIHLGLNGAALEPLRSKEEQ